MRNASRTTAFALIVWMFLPQTAWALLVIDDGPEYIKTNCEGAYRVKATRPPPMPGGGGGAGGTYVPVPGVKLTWKIIPSVGGGSFTTPMPTVTNASGHAFATYEAPDTVFVCDVKLQASGKCPRGSTSKDKKSREKNVTILGNPPAGFSDDPDPAFAGFDFQRYFLAGFTYLKMRISMSSPPTTEMQEMDMTLKTLRANASVRYDSTLVGCADYDEPFNAPPPYHIRFAHNNSPCMISVDDFTGTIVHEGRHAQCNLLFLNGQGDEDGNGNNDNDSDMIVDECDEHPDTFDPGWDDAEDHASAYESGHTPYDCP